VSNRTENMYVCNEHKEIHYIIVILIVSLLIIIDMYHASMHMSSFLPSYYCRAVIITLSRKAAATLTSGNKVTDQK
jgi:hypothetical protein